MNKTKNTSPNPKPQFDTKPYQRPGLSETDILQIKEAFDIFDREHTGLINPKELKNALAILGPEARNEPIYQLIVKCDAEGEGYITFEQFVHLLTPKLLNKDNKGNIESIFSLFDTQNTGFISTKDLRRIARDIGLELSEQQITDMIARADLDKDGRVSREQFYELLSNIVQ